MSQTITTFVVSIADLHAAAGSNKDHFVDSGIETLVIGLLNHYYAEGYILLKNGEMVTLTLLHLPVSP